MRSYDVLSVLARLTNRWITLVGERVRDEDGNLLDYWRVERPDSVIVLPILDEKIVLPRPCYRHGAGEFTYDFPGGRINEGDSPAETAYKVLGRELKVKEEDVFSLDVINKDAWIVDSSFSTQKVYAFQAVLQEGLGLDRELIAMQASTDKESVLSILKMLRCLQCRHALLEWMFLNYGV